jgi:MinD-like ATPase involved in chromosome partitioning or flagellar assembly
MNDWDEEELVGLDNLRPSRRIYKDVGGNDSRNQGQKSRRGSPQRRPSQGNSAGARSQSQKRQPQDAPRRRSVSEPQRRERQGQPRSEREQPNRSRVSATQRNVPNQRRSQGSRSAAREQDQFANQLARVDRQRSSNTPTSGWRSAVLRATGGVVNLGPSAHEQALQATARNIRRPVVDGKVAIFSRKGGVGKTTISAYLGLTLATERGGRIIALDGDAEAGSLGWLLAPRAPSTLAALASATPTPSDYEEIRRYTTTTPEGLDVVVGDPAEMGPVSVTGLEAVSRQLGRHYDMSIFDTGAGVTRASGRVLINSARTLLLVMSPSTDSVRAAERTLAWLDERPGEAANPNAKVIAVINGVPSNANKGHIEEIESHFSERCNGVVQIPWDAHLATGSSSVSLELLAKPTREAFVGLAATVVKSLARPTGKRPASRRRELVGV